MGHGSSRESHAHLHFLVHILFLFVCFSEIYAVRYVWKTGLWMECQHYDCGKGGSQFRSVYCGEQGEFNYNEFDSSKCSHMPKPSNKRDCFKVCDLHRQKLKWTVTMWSDCMLYPQYRECSIKHGIRYRNVSCVWVDNGQLEDNDVCAELEPKPDTEEKCNLKCPQDCVVTSFSSWDINNCDKCLIVNKTRTRELVVPPAHGGSMCPHFTEMIPCDNCSDIYTYKIGEWSECTQFKQSPHTTAQIQPIIGRQTRRIQCIDTNGNEVLFKFCVDFIRSTNTELIRSQTCIIPQDCVVSDWSQSSEHNSSCISQDGSRSQGYRVRYRHVETIPLGAGKQCPTLVHYFPFTTAEEEICPRFV
ncbi:Thrombospondin type-1 domain-containing protein 7A-like [Mactra antiquata]